MGIGVLANFIWIWTDRLVGLPLLSVPNKGTEATDAGTLMAVLRMVSLQGRKPSLMEADAARAEVTCTFAAGGSLLMSEHFA